MRKPYVVFHDGKRHSEVDSGWKAKDIPNGAYVYHLEDGYCYLVRWGNAIPINQCDVPAIARAYKLLLP